MSISSPASRVRLASFLLLVALFTALPGAARAAQGDLGDLDPDLRDDAALHERWADGAASGSLWLGVQAQLARRDDGRHELGALVLLGVPLERFGRPRPRRSDSTRLPRLTEGTAPSRTGARATSPAPAEAPLPAPAPVSRPAQAPPTPADPAALTFPLPITPAIARAAVAAALVEAHLADPEAPLDRLVSRARSAALLPELRLRVMRQLDEAQTVSPTEYDPDRLIASGGTSLWFEARATWRLDRLVFTDEEIAITRMRRERVEAQARVVRHVLDLLFAWQRAVVARDDPERDPEARLGAALAAVESEAALDVATGGWFSRSRKVGQL